MSRGKAKTPAPPESAHSEDTMEELVRKRDSFVTSMIMLRNAAEEASRAGLAYFDTVAGTSGPHPDIPYTRGMSMPGPSIGSQEHKRKRRAKRDPNEPKKPSTAYILFCTQGRETVKEDLGDGASYRDVLHELTRRWNEMAEDEKSAWQDIYKKNRIKYEGDLAAYKAKKTDEGGEEEDAATPTTTTTTAAGFTAVNHKKRAAGSDAGSGGENEASDAEEEAVEEEAAEEEAAEEEAEAPESEEEVPPSPPKSKSTLKGKKAVNGTVKKTPIKLPQSSASPPPSTLTKKPRKPRAKKADKVVVAVDGNAEEAEMPKKKKRESKRRKSSD